MKISASNFRHRFITGTVIETRSSSADEKPEHDVLYLRPLLMQDKNLMGEWVLLIRHSNREIFGAMLLTFGHTLYIRYVS